MPRTAARRRGGLHHKCRFVPLSAVWDGGQVGAVGLDQESIVGHERRGLTHRFGLGKSEHAAEAQMKAERQRLPGLRRVAGKTVHDAAVGQGSDLRDRIVPRLAGVDHDRLFGGRRDLQLAIEDRATV